MIFDISFMLGVRADEAQVVPGFYATALGQMRSPEFSDVQLEIPRKTMGKKRFSLWLCQPLAIENGHRNSGFLH